MAGQIIKSDGFGALYKGLSAGLLRQATYTTARMGLFNQFSTALKEMNQGQVGRLYALLLTYLQGYGNHHPCSTLTKRV